MVPFAIEDDVSMLKICSQSIGRPSRLRRDRTLVPPSCTPPALAAATASRVRDEISARSFSARAA
jgi:hypothetical protein